MVFGLPTLARIFRRRKKEKVTITPIPQKISTGLPRREPITPGVRPGAKEFPTKLPEPEPQPRRDGGGRGNGIPGVVEPTPEPESPLEEFLPPIPSEEVFGKIAPRREPITPGARVGAAELPVREEREVFTAAVDVGKGLMQDIKFTVTDGRIIKTERLGRPQPQTRRFRELGRVGKTEREVAREIRGVEGIPSLTGIVPSGTIIGEVPGIPAEAFGIPPSTVEPSDITFVESLRARVSTRRARGQADLTEAIVGFGAGVATSGIGTVEFGKQLVTQPLETVGRTIAALPQIPAALARAGAVIEDEPSFALGFAAGEFAQFKAIGLAKRGVIKGVDIGRTIRLKELPKEVIIAPEFFKGQTFPSIRRGQRAGELLEEFRPRLPGELRPAGFTSAPIPIAELTIRRGTSELPGLFQAPQVSPRFLRIAGEEQKLFTLSPFGETLRPTIIRVTPEEFRLVPGLRPTQRVTQPQKLREIKTFFEVEAERGVSFVPFIKTEKEAIIPFGTQLRPTGKRFFIKFEGRRIPITEFETLPPKPLKAPKVPEGLPTAKDIAKSLSESRIGRRGIVTPSELISPVAKIPSRRRIRVSRRQLISPTERFEAPSLREFEPIRPTRRVTPPPPSLVSDIPSRPRPRLLFDVPGIPPRIKISFDILEPSRRRAFFRGDARVGARPGAMLRQERIFVRTPSLGAIIKQEELRLAPVKLPKELERTGLVERAFLEPQKLPPLGAFKL